MGVKEGTVRSIQKGPKRDWVGGWAPEHFTFLRECPEETPKKHRRNAHTIRAAHQSGRLTLQALYTTINCSCKHGAFRFVTVLATNECIHTRKVPCSD